MNVSTAKALGLIIRLLLVLVRRANDLTLNELKLISEAEAALNRQETEG